MLNRRYREIFLVFVSYNFTIPKEHHCYGEKMLSKRGNSQYENKGGDAALTFPHQLAMIS